MRKKKGPFDMGEVRESKGTSPIPHRLSGKIGDVSDTEAMELNTRDEAFGARTNMTPASRASGSAWELRRVDPSPVSTVMSVTPRAGGRDCASISPVHTPLANEVPYSYDGNTNDHCHDLDDRQSMSPTPRPFTSQDHVQDFGDDPSNLDVYDNTNAQDNHNAYDWPNDQDWGDDAMMVWDATSGRDEDASSIDPEEAGVMDEDDDDDDWGGDALLAWDDYDDNDFTDDNESADHNDDFSAAGAPMDVSSDDAIAEEEDDVQLEETEDELVARGMPSYRDWTIKDLQVRARSSCFFFLADAQKLCSGYGYRPIGKHDALVDLAIQCWRAINTPARRPKLDFRAPSRSSSISSADMPLSKIREAKGAKGAKPKSKVLQNGKGKRVAPPALATSGPPPVDLSDRFLSMIRNDSALWLRILRYEVSCPCCMPLYPVVQTLTTNSADQL